MKIAKLLEFLNMGQPDDDVYIDGWTEWLEIRRVEADLGDADTCGTFILCTGADEYLPGDGPDDDEGDYMDDDIPGHREHCSIEPVIAPVDESTGTIEKP